MTKKYFYEKNTELLNSSVNKTFDEILSMNDIEFRQWVIELRKVVVDLWDNKGLPPRVGYDEQEIIENFSKMISYPINELEYTDELTGNKDVIRNTSVVGNAVNQWFNTMMKTKITYTIKESAKSIYDYFADPSLLDTFVTYAKRHFKRDSFYHYSTPISFGDVLDIDGVQLKVESAKQFIEDFPKSSNWGYWFCPVKKDKKYTGFNHNLAKKRNVILEPTFFAEQGISNVSVTNMSDYTIRVYKKGQKLFPIGLKAFRISFCQYATNFPPLTARYLYEKFTAHIKDSDPIILYDPSCGWGGRLLGALSAGGDRIFHYIGTDPNSDHTIGKGRTKYDDIGDFFNEKVRGNKLFETKNTFEIFQLGSEVISNDSNFSKYKGKIDLVFTSPPYFSKEVYSDDPEQSCHKFNQYEFWREGFLRPTLTTAVEYLKHDRYLLWNIADAMFDGKLLPLEQDSKDILESLGMTYVKTLKMSLAQMPGGNRLKDTGNKKTLQKNTVFGVESEESIVYSGMMKNFCSIKSNGKNMLLKYEPIFVFYKE